MTAGSGFWKSTSCRGEIVNAGVHHALIFGHLLGV